jgi:hypothetical protein
MAGKRTPDYYQSTTMQWSCILSEPSRPLADSYADWQVGSDCRLTSCQGPDRTTAWSAIRRPIGRLDNRPSYISEIFWKCVSFLKNIK